MFTIRERQAVHGLEFNPRFGNDLQASESVGIVLACLDERWTEDKAMVEGLRILVVEDNAAIRASLAALLEFEGFDVVAVSEYHRACELIEKELFDTLITDLDLPDGTGVDL